MAVVKFNNTLNVGYTVANTATPVYSFEFPIPPGDKNDTIIVIASGNTATNGHTANIQGYLNWYGSTDPSGGPFYGNFYIGSKISNGQETVGRVRHQAVGQVANYCVIAMRVKGAHRITPLSSTVANNSVDGVAAITVGDATQRALGDGQILMTVCTSQSNTAFSDSDIPSGTTLIAKANTESTALIAAYQERAQWSTYGNIVWGRTLDNKEAVTFSIVPDTEVVGVLDGAATGASGSDLTSNSSQRLNYGAPTNVTRLQPVFLAREDEEVGEVGCGLSTNTGDGSGLKVAIYDVGNGYSANAVYVGESTVTNLSTASLTRTTFYPPIKLTPGRRYVTAFSTNSATNLRVTNAGYIADSAVRTSSQNGTIAFPPNWDYDTTGAGAAGSVFYVFGTVRNPRKLYISSAGYFNNTVSGTSHSGDFRADPGTRRKIVVMGFAEDQTLAMANCRFDGVPMTSNFSQKLSGVNDAFSVWYYDVPDSGGQLMDFAKDFVEFDPGADLSLTGNNQINITAMDGVSASETGYRLDCGTAWKTGDFRVRLGPINLTAATSSASVFTPLSIQTATGGGSGSNETPSIQIRWNRTASSTNAQLQLVQFNSSTTSTTSPAGSTTYDGPEVYLNTPFYLELNRVGSTGYCRLYKDSNFTNLVTTLSLSLTEVASLRYCYVASRYPTGTAATVTGTIQNLRFMDASDAGTKKISMETLAATSVCSWQAWQLNNAEPEDFEAFGNTYSALGVSTTLSNTVTVSEGSMILATAVSSSSARRWSWNEDVVLDRVQPAEENDFRIATADRIQYTGGSKTITATSTGTEGSKYLVVTSIKPYKSKKVKTGAF